MLNIQASVDPGAKYMREFVNYNHTNSMSTPVTKIAHLKTPKGHHYFPEPIMTYTIPTTTITATAAPIIRTVLSPPPEFAPVPPCTPWRARSCEALNWSSLREPPAPTRFRNSDAEYWSSAMVLGLPGSACKLCVRCSDAPSS
mmetsp:Transcript_41493/g.77197  ORF Transcript_41493/g.77197 Transcript_41493/m.77197 type:complete len:143 (-) Transcript_41493:8-436(-)